jgi:integrase
MTETQARTELVPVVETARERNRSAQVTAIQRAGAGTSDYVPHLSVDDVRLMAEAAGENRRHGERNGLLVKTIFDGAFRVSEALGIRPVDLGRDTSGWSVRVLGKGGKVGKVAISASLAAELQSYAWRRRMGETDRFFPVSRSQAFRIVTGAYEVAGIRRPGIVTDRVGAVHILRHSGAIERLRQTGNPKAVQDQLRHSSARMTLRYMKTLSAKESLSIQQGVDFRW